MTSLPCWSSGTNGIGGQGMTLAIEDSSSGAASAAATKPAIVVRGRGQDEHPADDRRGRSWSWNRKRVTTPKLPPPPRMAQKRSGSVWASTTRTRPSAVTISAARSESMVRPKRAHEVADAAAGDDAAEADGPGVTEAGREAVLGRGLR